MTWAAVVRSPLVLAAEVLNMLLHMEEEWLQVVLAPGQEEESGRGLGFGLAMVFQLVHSELRARQK